MTTGQQRAVDQRLDQHADAVEILLDRIDALQRQLRILHRHREILHHRITNLESIILHEHLEPP